MMIFFGLRVVDYCISLLCLLSTVAAQGSSYWVANIKRSGSIAFGSNSTYNIYRNVKTYGAKGDGITDDTAAINNAIADGSRCGLGCDSTTITPAIIYFPPGTYMVSAPVVMYYFSQLVGDAISPPTIMATSGFNGNYVLDSDVYIPGGYGATWYTNQNNFYRQVRNFVIDITQLPPSRGQCIHWQVAQATSLQNIVFNMVQGGTNNQQIGIFMDNGSGGWMTDLVFVGGNQGAFLGNQQFTTRNLTFTGCNTAIFMNWDWSWTFKSLTITNCQIGIDMSNGGTDSLTVGSVVVLDSVISANTAGILTNYVPGRSSPPGAGALVVENVDFRGSNLAISSSKGLVILAGGQIVDSFAQGNAYTTAGERITSSSQLNGTTCTYSNTTQSSYSAQETTIQQKLAPIARPPVLQGSNDAYFERSRPQYETIPASSFLSAKAFGCIGDGIADDTVCVQNFLNQASNAGQVAYFDHGAYRITDTVHVPTQIKITGEVWPMIMASGFTDQNNPKPMFQVGLPGQTGSVEMSDLVFQTIGSNPGAVLVEWNLMESSQGACGMWDVHWRIGGSAGTQLQSDRCAKNPSLIADANVTCEGAFLLLHVTSQGSVYLENVWAWVADHELDLLDHGQVNIYNGRGILIESETGPVWMYGVASEHSVLYNFQISNAANVFGGLLQTETAYMQANPNALQPFTANTAYTDPTFSNCTTSNCYKTWGLRIVNSSDIFVYGAGMYSFFDNYNQACLDTESCQRNMVDIIDSKDVYLWSVSTKAAQYMVTYMGFGVVGQGSNDAGFCQTIVLFEAVTM